MREFSFPLTALGSDAAPTPDFTDVSAWIAKIRGTEADVISYQTDTLLARQIPHVAIPAAGGRYYRRRILDAFGAPEGDLGNAPDMQTATIEDDIVLARKSAKTCWFSLPSPGLLELIDQYYHDSDELMEAVTDAYIRLCRVIRDCGILGCVLLSETPTDIELEKLHGLKYLWSSADTALETVLEQTRDVVIPASAVSRLAELADSYAIRNIYLKDADRESLKTALETVKPENLFTAGYAVTDAPKNYWKDLANVTVPVKNLEI